MGILRAIVLPEPLLMGAGQTKVPERCSVGGELVGDQQFRREAQFPEELAHQAQRRPLVAPALNQHVEDLALMIDGAPQVHPLAGDPYDHLVEVPSLARMWAAAPQIARDHRTEFQHPTPHRFVGHVEPALGQESSTSR
jgi:hypothetical protein